jgi:hypothetical protein
MLTLSVPSLAVPSVVVGCVDVASSTRQVWRIRQRQGALDQACFAWLAYAIDGYAHERGTAKKPHVAIAIERTPS